MPKGWLSIIPVLAVVLSACTTQFTAPQEIGRHDLSTLPRTASIACFEGGEAFATVEFFGNVEEDNVLYVSSEDKLIAVIDIEGEELYLKTGDGWEKMTSSELDRVMGLNFKERLQSCAKKIGIK